MSEGLRQQVEDMTAFVKGTKIVERFIGTVSGSYRRNQATVRVEDMLRTIGKEKGTVVPHVIATVSAAEMKGVPFIAMEMLNGESLGKAAYEKKIKYDNDFIRQETWMQLQDVLTGQIDRHGDNVMLTENGPVAIDHDLSFPTSPPRDFADKVPKSLVGLFQVRSRQKKKLITTELAVDEKSPRNYCVPPVIDQEMFGIITAIDLDKLRATYQECGLTRLEIQAAMGRAEGLKRAAEKLKNQGRVIESDQWETSPLVKEH
ncbi:MAG: hypothetical protein LBD34_02210 [Puniceicoccales bacterium]|jgi:hypothetical protein|nr:hypothetical protein [Puniceicoccales bacterium]